METPSNLPPIFQQFQQPQNERYKTLKIIVGLFLIITGTISVISNIGIGGLLRLTAGLLLFPPTLPIIENMLGRKIERVTKYVLIVALIFIGSVVSLVSSIERGSDTKLDGNTSQGYAAKAPPKQEIIEPQTTDSISLDGKTNRGQIQMSDEERQEKIKHIFSPWNGAAMKLVFYVKKRMNDPDSFEHVKTVYWNKGNYLVVLMQYREKNAFGGKVVNYVKAKKDLGGEVITILETE